MSKNRDLFRYGEETPENSKVAFDEQQRRVGNAALSFVNAEGVSAVDTTHPRGDIEPATQLNFSNPNPAVRTKREPIHIERDTIFSGNS